MMDCLDRLRAITILTPVGSRVTCNPAPTDTDQDFLVWLTDETSVAFYNTLSADGWEIGGSIIDDDVNYVPKEDRFRSYHLDYVNLIVTKSASFHRRFLAATSVAKRLNLLDKADRVALFQAVLYGNEDVPEPVIAPEDEVAF